jgi:hypothetical protein
MLANFFEGVDGHDRNEMGKNVYKKGDLTVPGGYQAGRGPWRKLAWSSL